MMSTAVLSLLVLGATPATAAIAHPDIRFERVALANGLTGLLLRDPAAPMVGVFAMIRAGVAHERPGEDGLSHFLEHLLFNGTDTMSQEQLYAAFDELGGYSNATTRTDHTLFQALVPAQHLKRALELQSAMLYRSTFPAEKFEKERGIVLEEIAKDDADPGNGVDAAFARLLLESTPLARPVIGTPGTIQGIDRERVMAYWKRRYVPANTVVLVVGDASLEDFRTALTDTYGRASAEELAPLPDPVPVLARTERTVIEVAATPRIEARLGWPGPDPASAEVWPLDLLAAILGSDPKLGLDAQLRDAGIEASGSAGLMRSAGITWFELRASAPPGTSPKALTEAMTGAVARAAAAGAEAIATTNTQLAVASAFLAEKPHYYGIEKSATLANGGAGALEGEGTGLAAVTPRTLLAVADRWLVARPHRALVRGPGLEASGTAIAAPGEMAATPSAPANPGTRRVNKTLANGLVLSVAENPATSVFAAHVLVRDRAAMDSRERPGLPDLVHRLLTARGDAFAAKAASIGAAIKATDSPSIPYDDYYSVPEWGYVRLETVDAFADVAIALLAEMLSPLTADEAAIARARSEQAAARSRDAAAAGRSQRLLAAAMYGDAHPSSRPTLGNETAQPASADIASFALTYLAPERLIVTIETGENADAIADAIAASPLGRASRGTARTPAILAPPRQPRSSDESAGAPQAYVRIGAALRVAPADRAAAMLAAAVLSERLAADIREKRGLSYSVGSGLTLRPAPWSDSWSASAGTRPDNADVVRDLLVSITAALVREGPSEQEVRLAASRAEGRSLMRLLSGIGRAYHNGLDLFLGEEPGAGLDRVRGLERVSAAEVKVALRRYFDPSRASVAVVR